MGDERLMFKKKPSFGDGLKGAVERKRGEDDRSIRLCCERSLDSRVLLCRSGEALPSSRGGVFLKVSCEISGPFV